MELDDASREFTRYTTIWGIYEVLFLPMGISPASDIFFRWVAARMANFKPNYTKCYIDNILAALDHNFDDHLEYLDQIFTRMGEAGDYR